MFCYFCGNHTPDKAQYCPYCGAKLKKRFHYDNAYISNEAAISKTAVQYMDILFSAISPFLLLSSFFFWLFYNIEHHFSRHSVLGINIQFIVITAIVCILACVAFAFLQKKKKFPSIIVKFNIVSVIVVSILAFLFNYFGILTPLGSANTIASLTETYNFLLTVSILLFLLGVVLLCIEIIRKRLCFHSLLNSILITCVYECCFYFVAFNYSASASKTIAMILYCLPLIGGFCLTIYYLIKAKLH
jgi:hypothetical protein